MHDSLLERRLLELEPGSSRQHRQRKRFALAPFVSWGYGRRTTTLPKEALAMKNLSLLTLLITGLNLGCTAEPPVLTLSGIAVEAAGENCAAGGLKVTTGKDTDGNGTLDAAEVTGTDYVCNGETGAQGAAHISQSTEEPAGENCVRGGYRVDFGVDADGDGALTEAEVSATEYLCNPERPTEGNIVIRKTFVGNADAACAGGYLRLEYGFDADGDAALSDEEITSTFMACNQAPLVAPIAPIEVANCAEAVEINAEVSDVDGAVESYAWTVLSSASELTLEGADTATVRIAAGEHLAGARLQLVATDNYGAASTVVVNVVFTGEGCRPLNTFYGVDPSSCSAIDIENTAGDDRGGVVLSSNYVYYNGDDALVRANRDLTGLQTIGPDDVDTLFSETDTGRLFSLWNSEAELADLTAASDGELSAYGANFDQVVLINEETLAPSNPVALPFTIRQGSHNIEIEGQALPRYAYSTLLSARAGRLVVGQYVRDTVNGQSQYKLIYSVINLSSGELISQNVVLREDGTPEDRNNWDRKRFDDQETRIARYPMTVASETETVIVMRSNGWVEYNVTTDTATTRTETFADECDVENLALSADHLTAYFHDEGSCFTNLNSDETIVMCDALPTENLEGAIDDRG